MQLRLRLLALLLPLLPLPARAPKPSAQDMSLGVDWLTRYGYLPPPNPAQAQLQSPAKLRDAIKVMQRFAGLPETGRMDPETVATMRKPRCSLPDVLGVAGLVRRRRRYALSGSVWKKRTLTWRVRSFPQSSQLSQETVRVLMNYALMAWGMESDLTFHEVDSSQGQEPDILIDFARAFHQDSYPFDGLGGTLAHAFFPGEHPISGDTHFDDEETWTFGSTGSSPEKCKENAACWWHGLADEMSDSPVPLSTGPAPGRIVCIAICCQSWASGRLESQQSMGAGELLGGKGGT